MLTLTDSATDLIRAVAEWMSCDEAYREVRAYIDGIATGCDVDLGAPERSSYELARAVHAADLECQEILANNGGIDDLKSLTQDLADTERSAQIAGTDLRVGRGLSSLRAYADAIDG